MAFLAIGRMFVGAALPEWIMSFEELEKPAPLPDGQPNWLSFNVMRQVVHQARNDIVNSFLKATDCKYLFFLDDDICLKPEGLRQLLASSIEYDAPVVTGLYIQRGEPHMPVIFRHTDDGRYIHLNQYVAGMQEVDACGAGCLLLRRDVLEAIQERLKDTGLRWFDYIPGVMLSEDMAFCTRVQEAGFKIALNADVRCDHLSIVRVAPEMYEDRLEHGFYSFDSEETKRWATDVRPMAKPASELIVPHAATPKAIRVNDTTKVARPPRLNRAARRH